MHNIIKIVIAICLILCSVNFVHADDYIIDGNSVYIDNQYAYVKLYPHTLNESGFVYIQLISKQFTGNIDVAFGFNSSNCIPKDAWLLINGEYVKINKLFEHVTYNYQNYDSWYLLRQVAITKNVLYHLRISLDVRYGKDGKYFMGFKRSVDPISSAIVIDPWYNSQWHYYKKITVANNNVGYQTRMIITNSITLNGHLGQNDFGDLRFTKTDNTTLTNYWIESYKSGDSAVVWVRCTNENYIYMYYGNHICTDGSNMANTWDYSLDWNSDLRASFTQYTNADSKYSNRVISLGMTFNSGTGYKMLSCIAVTNKNPLPANVNAYLGLTATADDYYDINDGLYPVYVVDSDYDPTDYMMRIRSEDGGVSTNGDDKSYDPVLNEWNIHLIKVRTNFANLSITKKYSNNTLLSGRTITTVLTDNLGYLGYGSYFYTATGSNDYWGYDGTNKAVIWGATGSGASDITMKSKYTVIGEYVSTEPSFTISGEIEYNRHPIASNPNPANHTTGVALIVTWSCTINDLDGNTFNYNITCSNGQYLNAVGSTNGSKSINLVGLAYATNYTIWVNITDLQYYNATGSYSYWFITLLSPPPKPDYPPQFRSVSPSNNTHECPCCLIMCINNISDNDSMFMNITFRSNLSGSWQIIEEIHNVTNGSYCIIFCDFSIFNWKYYWNVSIDDGNTTVYSDNFTLYTDSVINCSDVIDAYNKTESDNMFLGAVFNIESGLLFLLIALGLWIFFVTQYMDKRNTDNNGVLGIIQFVLCFPLLIILSTYVLNYPYGFIIVAIIPILSIILLIDAFFNT